MTKPLKFLLKERKRKTSFYGSVLAIKGQGFQTSFVGFFYALPFFGNLLQSRSNFHSGMAFKIKTVLKRGNKHIHTVLYTQSFKRKFDIKFVKGGHS